MEKQIKFSEISNVKSKIMESLEKAVNEMLDQLQANELMMAADASNQYISLEPAYFDAKLVMDLPEHCGSNGKGFHIMCNAVVILKKDHYLNEDLQKSRYLLKEKLAIK